LVLALWERLRATIGSFTIYQTPVFANRYARVVYASAMGIVGFVMTVLLDQAAPAIVYKAF
jgi:hypothetical protein